jgi:hypothetical protein
MPDGPQIVIETEKFRIVRGANGNYTVEKYEGYDAMGAPRWRDLKFGEADQTSRLLRDWIFAHAAKCPLCQGVTDAEG